MQITTPRESIALHEAAHATVAERLGFRVASIEVQRSHGCTLMEPLDACDLEQTILYGVAIAEAGRLSEQLAGLAPPRGTDEERLEKLAGLDFERRLPRDLRDRRAIVHAASRALGTYARGRALSELLVRSEWSAITRLAEVLARAPYLRGAQARDLLALAPSRPFPCGLDRLRALAKAAGACAALAGSASFAQLVERCVREPHDAALAALLEEGERGSLEQRPAPRPSPSERPAPGASWFSRFEEVLARKRLEHRMAGSYTPSTVCGARA